MCPFSFRNLILINCFLKFSNLQTAKRLSFITGLLDNGVSLKKKCVPVLQIIHIETYLVFMATLFISIDENNIQ